MTSMYKSKDKVVSPAKRCRRSKKQPHETNRTFNLSAPGRIFLSGDPTRYNKICIAASLNMRTKLAFSLTEPSEHQDIEINFSAITLHMKIPLQIFFEYFDDNYLNRTLTNAELHEGVKNFVSSLKQYTGTYEPYNRVHCLSLQAFFFLLIVIANEENIKIQSFIVEISTELAIGEGLGSSTSFSTCLAGCFYRWSFLQKEIIINFDEHLTNILRYVQKCDCTIYNTSTLIDSVICVYGSIHVFREEVATNAFCDMPNIKIVLVFSNSRQRTTIMQSERTNSLRQLYPFIESIQKSIDEIVDRSISIFENLEDAIWNLEDNMTYKSDVDLFHLIPTGGYGRLLRFIQMNQGLLRALDMSIPNLDIICAIAQEFLLAGKLASNGGGGYAFILLLPNSTPEIIDQLVIKLKSYDFSAKITNLNCSGLRLEQ